MQAVIFIGAQAAGKSSFYAARFAHTHLRINLDILRTRHRERRLVALCCELGQPFLVDNTNPTTADRARYLIPASAAGFEVIGYYFSSKASELLARNQNRLEPEQVPDKAIFGTLARLQSPVWDEGFNSLFYVRLDNSEGFVVEPWDVDAQ